MPLSLSMYNGEFDHSCGGEGGGGPAAVTVVAVAVVEYNYRQKRPATRSLTVA